MTVALRNHLVSLYGEAALATLAPRLDTLLAAWRADAAGAPVAPERSTLTERDALLITYGDQVRAEGEPPLQTLADFAGQHLRDVVSGLHVLPFYPWSSDDGFAVKDFFAVDPALGGWDDIARLGRHFDLMFDAVVNHLSAESDWFRRFLRGDPAYRDFFVTVDGSPDLSQVVRPRALPLLTEFATAAGPRRVWTTFSADQVDLNFKNPAVLLAVLEALRLYVARGAKFIRLDAIAYLWKEPGTPCIHLPQTHRVIQLMRAVLDETAPGVRLITETNVPHVDNLSYFGDGTNEAQLVYNFALPPLVLHALATGSAEKLARWTRSLVLPSDCVTFFNFLASHDGIGLNPARGLLTDAEIAALVARTLAHGGFISYKHNPDGSRSPYEMNISFFDAVSDPASDEPSARQVGRFLVAQAILLALVGVPGIYFHSLFGSRNDRAAAEASGIPRRINRQKLTRPGLERALADAASVPAQVFAGFRRLLAVRRRHAAFHPSGRQAVPETDARVFAVLRSAPAGDEHILCLHNLSDQPVPLALAVPPAAPGRAWRDLLGPPRPIATAAGRLALTLAPYQVSWLRAG